MTDGIASTSLARLCKSTVEIRLQLTRVTAQGERQAIQTAWTPTGLVKVGVGEAVKQESRGRVLNYRWLPRLRYGLADVIGCRAPPASALRLARCPLFDFTTPSFDAPSVSSADKLCSSQTCCSKRSDAAALRRPWVRLAPSDGFPVASGSLASSAAAADVSAGLGCGSMINDQVLCRR